MQSGPTTLRYVGLVQSALYMELNVNWAHLDTLYERKHRGTHG